MMARKPIWSRHYERLPTPPGHADNNSTTGRIYLTVIDKERKGSSSERRFRSSAHHQRLNDHPGGRRTGCGCRDHRNRRHGRDIEMQPFWKPSADAATNRQGELDFCALDPVPFIATPGSENEAERKHSVKELREIGIQPDILSAGPVVCWATTSKARSRCSATFRKRMFITALDVQTSMKCRSSITVRDWMMPS